MPSVGETLAWALVGWIAAELIRVLGGSVIRTLWPVTRPEADSSDDLVARFGPVASPEASERRHRRAVRDFERQLSQAAVSRELERMRERGQVQNVLAFRRRR